MTILDDILLEASIENIKTLTKKYIEHSLIVQADDYVEINAQIKQPNGKRLSVADNFVDVLMNHPTFNRTISGYQHNETGVFYSPKQLTTLANKMLYTTIYRLTIKPDANTVITYDRNTIFIKIIRLAHFDKSRYRALINVLIDSDLFIHKARKESSQKNIYNNMRQIIRRDFKLFNYEWGFTFNSEISRVLLPALKRIAVNTQYGTYYLYGGKRTQCTIKAYNITAAQDDRKKKQYQFISDDLIKFEVTYRPEFFKRHDYTKISDLKSQLDIFTLLLDDNLNQFKKHLLNKLTRTELNCLLKAAKVESIGELMDTLKKTHTIQTNVDAELQDIRNQLANLTQSVEETRNIAEENKTDISEIKDFLGLQEAKKDNRKLRAIK